jgi:flavodoxin
MKILIVYYSFEGNCKFVAEEISKNLNAEILELKPKTDLKAKGVLKYVFGGKQAVTNEKPELFPLEKDIDSYDFIFLGTPVRAWNYAPALKTFFSKYKIKEKKVALFCCSGGGIGKTLENMKKELCESEIMGEMEFRNPLKQTKHNVGAEIGKWVDNIMETF